MVTSTEALTMVTSSTKVVTVALVTTTMMMHCSVKQNVLLIMQHAAEQEKTVVLVSLLTACVVSKAILDVAATTIGITAIAGSITGNVLVPLHSF